MCVLELDFGWTPARCLQLVSGCSSLLLVMLSVRVCVRRLCFACVVLGRGLGALRVACACSLSGCLFVSGLSVCRVGQWLNGAEDAK